jgi:hypothetical protein
MVSQTPIAVLHCTYVHTACMQAPLEAVGKRIRQGQKIDLGFLKSLTKRKRLGIVVAAVAVASFALAVEMRNASYWNLYNLIEVRSATAVR